MNSIYAKTTALRQLTFSIFALLLTWAAATAQPLTTSWIFDGNVLTGTSNQAAATANNATYGAGVTGQGFVGGNPSTGRAITGAGWGSGNPSTFLADDYFGFSFTLGGTPCQVVKLTNLTFDSQRSGTGPATWEVRTSLDNFASTVATGTNPTAFAGQTATLTQTVTAGQTFEVRVYGYGATATGGTFRLDNVNINGTLQVGPSAADISGSGTFCVSGNLNFSVAVTGGTGPYSVVYTDGTSNFTQNNYTSGATISRNVTQTTTFTLVSVTDANNCAAGSLTGSAIATVSNNPIGVTFAVTQPTCSNNDGAINATITGGTAPLTYTWTTVGGSGLVPGVEDQTGLSAGQYTLVVSDPLTCSASASASLSIPANCADCPSASVLNVVNVDCNNPTGSITFGASGGNPPYSFNIGGGAQASGLFAGLAPGTYTVTVTDVGNCTQTVTASATVQNLPDTQAPTFNQNPLPQNGALSCTDPVPPAATLTATDNCDGAVPVIFTQNTTPGTCPQNSTITRTWTATDLAGNSRQHTQTITISDTQVPTLNGLPAATLSISCELPLPAAPTVTASDNCDTNVPVNFSTSTTPGNCPQRRTVTRTWSATDDCGNTAVFTQTITVTDNVPPVFNQPLPPNQSISCSAGMIPTAPQVTATDNCDPGQVPSTIFINEIHYDNVGTDAGEFVEVAGTAGLNLANYALVLYNGNGGVTYDTLALSGLIDNEAAGFGAVSFAFPSNGIQNGSPDGIALVTLPSYMVLQFLSYEGPFAATNGPAMGMTATDIGVQEDGTNALGTSVQLTGTGQQGSQFTWVGPLAASAGSLNAGQTVNPLPATIVATVMQTMMMGMCNGEMTVMRTWTATDACGNSTQYTQTIQVEDNAGPSFAPPLPANITLNCTDPVPPPATMIATDACDLGAPMEPWINEFHYDNTGTDVGEFFEIAGPAGTNLAEYSLFLYNGSGGGTYGSMVLSGTIDNEQNGFGAVSFSYPANGLQNGAPDGVALVHGGMVVQFLSYEGTMTAVGGPANGMVSTDIGVFEVGTEPVGQSLRLSGTGNKYTDFVWNSPATATPGTVNTGQTFTAVPPAFPITFNETMSGPPANCVFGKTITRTWTVQDNCGNVNTHTQVITVTDNIAPVVTCQPLTVNLDIFGNATVNQSQITYSATDNCSAASALVVLPNSFTYTCATAAAPPPFILSVRDQCGNVGVCSVAISIPAFARCVPKILISDPCVCKNNATTLDNGQFGETIKVESLSGKVWTVTQASGLYAANSPLPPGQPLSILGTVLTEMPLNSGDYFLNGIHVDALGYTVTIVSQQGEVLTIGNSCAYPNPLILSNLDGPFCLYSDSVSLVGNPGDLNFVSATFTVNGQPATAFNPGAGVGQYIIEYTVDGGLPKAFGATDPGCIQKVSKTVNVVATPSQLSRDDHVYFSLDADCSEEILPDQVLEGSYGCYDDYEVKLTTLFGAPLPSIVMTSLDIGKTYKVTVKHLVSGNSCWGLITIEDKLPPVLTCQDIQITCAVMEFSPDYLKNTLKFNQATPTVTDCSPTTLAYKDTWVDLACGQGVNGVPDLSAYIRREWQATDAWNNFSVCTQYIYLKRRHVQDVKFPGDVDVSCSAPNTEPDVTGAPWFEDFGLKFTMYPNTAYCELNAIYNDQVLPVCGSTYKIIRTWTVYDWCLPTNPGPTGNLNPRYHTQVIKVLDVQAPTLTCPTALTVSTDPNTCCGTINLPDVILTDNCSKLSKFSAKVEGFELLTGAPFNYDLVGGFGDFPGNNYWNPDTMGTLGYTPCLPMGTHTVTYRAEDECGNIRACSFQMTVADLVPPVPVCIDVVQVGLTNTGQTQIMAASFDNGSYDNCGPVTFGAGRSSGSSSSLMSFSCSDIGKTITVFLIVTDQSGNTNECMVNALVEDKLKPLCTPPASVTVTCENFDPSLWPYGNATGVDNCEVDKITNTVDYTLFDTLCNRGTITRNFFVSDKAGNSSQCTQRIFSTYAQDYFIRFPDDRTVTTCDGTGNFGEPTFSEKDCELLGVSFTDEIFTVVPDACFKIERTWNIINWCKYNSNQPLTDVPNPSPNATVNHPSNNIGPVISSSSNPNVIATPWNATRVAITPGVPVTDYTVFYFGGTYTFNGQTITVPSIANSNGFSYKQIIKVLDAQDPTVENCPTSPVTFCDLTPNSADLWNEPYWYDATINSHNICEGPADLSITATDACSGAAVNFRYLLFLDTDNNGSMETVISSTNLPGFNNVNFNNALNVNFGGGTPQAFDERPVPSNQKYGFALQVTTSGLKKTGAVRWNTFQAQNTYVVPELPYGTHKIKWFVDDGCGNETVCEYTFVVKDCKAPTVVCKNGLSVNIMPTGMVTLWASDFLQYAEDNCTPNNRLRIGIRRAGTGTGFPVDAQGNPITSVTFTCADIGQQSVELWAQDLAGNADFCLTYVIVQDNTSNCVADKANVAGALKTEGYAGLEEADVQIVGSTIATQTDLTDNAGAYEFLKAVPYGDNATITPTHDNNPLNGVSTYDLVLISKHILGLEPLDSPYKMICADANKSGSITTFDIVEVRKLILGIYTELPNNTSWRFTDSKFVFPDPTNPFKTLFPENISLVDVQAHKTEQDFVAMKIGDVNGSATANSLTSTEDRTEGTLFFDLDDRKTQAGETFEVKFRAAEKTQGYQFTLNLNGLELAEVLKAERVSASNFGIFSDALTVSVDGAEEFVLRFRATKSGRLSDMMSVSGRITKAEAYQNDGMANDAMTKMAVALRFGSPAGTTIVGVGFELYQNQPNPFVSKTSIGFHLPEAATATLTVFDESGRTLLTQKSSFAKGYNTMPVTVPQGAGLLYYRLDTGTDSATRKMVRE